MQRTLDRLRAGEPVTLVSLGDSTSVLCGHTKGHLPWLGYLHLALAETYGDGIVYTVNSAVCGHTVAKQLLRLEQDALRFGPDLAILSFGVNDAGGGAEGLEQFRADYRELVGRLRAVGCEALIRTHAPIVYGYGYPPGALPAGAKPGEAWAGEGGRLTLYAEALRELGQELGCPCCDIYGEWSAAEFPCAHLAYSYQGLCSLYADLVHPNAQGHLAIFRSLAPFFGVPRHFTWEEAR